MEKRLTYRACCLLLACRLLILIVIALITNPLMGKNKESKGLETVVIDAGHGGKDPGAIVGKAREKDIVLAIALRLGNTIKAKLPGVKVIYTRSTDVFVPLFERSVIANKNNADLFISIHANYCSTPAIKGTESYVLGLHRTEDNLNVAKKENSVILLENDYTTRYEGFDPNLSESYIMFELIQDTHIEQSLAFAGILQDSFRKRAQRASRDVRQAGFLVLRETAMPGVLIETGYLSNPSEAKYLMSEEGKETLASSIFNSFKSYKEKFETRLNLATRELNKEPAEVINPVTSEQKTAAIPKETRIQTHTSKQNEDKTADKEAVNAQIRPSKKELQGQVRKETGITFAIQLSASPKKLSLKSKIFKGIGNILEFNVNGTYKYYCIENKSLATTKDSLSVIRKKIPDAFIIAFKNGQPIPIKEALNGK
ncbi:MAG: N-acetylmuramoyl-L-alanine amidase [Mariniphaga sp.]